MVVKLGRLRDFFSVSTTKFGGGILFGAMHCILCAFLD